MPGQTYAQSFKFLAYRTDNQGIRRKSSQIWWIWKQFEKFQNYYYYDDFLISCDLMMDAIIQITIQIFTKIGFFFLWVKSGPYFKEKIKGIILFLKNHLTLFWGKIKSSNFKMISY